MGITQTIFNEDDIEIFVNLGLQRVQARIYLTLVSLGEANAKKIAQTAEVDQSQVYQVLEDLHQRALIEKIIKIPTEYQPMPLNEAIETLIGQREKKTDDIKKKAEAILRKTPAMDAKIEKVAEFFTIIPHNDFREKYVIKANNLVQNEWTTYTQIDRFPITCVGYHDIQKKAYDRGVRTRYLLELNKPTEKIYKFIEKVKKEYPKNEIRFVNDQLMVSYAIYDKKEMNFSIRQIRGLSDSDILVTNNTQLVKVVQELFESKWKTAMKNIPKIDGK